MEGVKHEQGLFQFSCSVGAQRLIVEQSDQRGDVIAAMHVAQQPDGMLAVNQIAAGLSLRQRRQKAGFDIGGLINPRRHALGQQFNKKGLLTRRWALQQLHQVGNLLRRKRGRGDVLGGAVSDVLAIGFQHLQRPFACGVFNGQIIAWRGFSPLTTV